LLEKGEAVEAAAIVEEMKAVIARGPAAMTERELSEARSVLARCGSLEEGLRANTLASLQRLGALRRSRVYGRVRKRP
jgi:hypothetical protein